MGWALTIGKAFSMLKQRPDRSVILLLISEDVHLAFRIGYELATTDITPDWKPVSEFKNLRK